MINSILDTILQQVDLADLYIVGICIDDLRPNIEHILIETSKCIVTNPSVNCVFGHQGRSRLVDSISCIHVKSLKLFPPTTVVLDIQHDIDLCIKLMHTFMIIKKVPRFLLHGHIVEDRLVTLFSLFDGKSTNDFYNNPSPPMRYHVVEGTAVFALDDMISSRVLESVIQHAFFSGYRYIELWITWDINIEDFYFYRDNPESTTLTSFEIVFESIYDMLLLHPRREDILLLDKQFKYIIE